MYDIVSVVEEEGDTDLGTRLRGLDRDLALAFGSSGTGATPSLESQLLSLHRAGQVWARLAPPGVRQPSSRGYLLHGNCAGTALTLAPEEFLAPLHRPPAVTRWTDVWLVAWMQQPPPPGSIDVTALRQALHSAFPENTLANEAWTTLARTLRCSLNDILAHVWHVTCTLGGPPTVETWPETGDWPCAMVLRRAWRLAGDDDDDGDHAEPPRELAWDPAQRAPPLPVRAAIKLVPVNTSAGAAVHALPAAIATEAERDQTRILCAHCGNKVTAAGRHRLCDSARVTNNPCFVAYRVLLCLSHHGADVLPMTRVLDMLRRHAERLLFLPNQSMACLQAAGLLGNNPELGVQIAIRLGWLEYVQ